MGLFGHHTVTTCIYNSFDLFCFILKCRPNLIKGMNIKLRHCIKRIENVANVRSCIGDGDWGAVIDSIIILRLWEQSSVSGFINNYT